MRAKKNSASRYSDSLHSFILVALGALVLQFSSELRKEKNIFFRFSGIRQDLVASFLPIDCYGLCIRFEDEEAVIMNEHHHM